VQNFDWCKCILNKGPSIKNVRSQGGSWSSADIFRTRGRGFFRCGRPHFDSKKLQNLWCVRMDREEGSWASADKRGGGQFFAILCGRLLWTAP